MLTIHIDKKYISTYVIFAVMLIKYLLPYFINRVLESYALLDLMVTLLSVALMTVFLITRRKAVKITILSILLMYGALFISTAINGGNVYRVFLHVVEVLLLCMFIDSILEDELALNVFLTVIRDITLLFYIINFFVIILMPNGIPSISVGKLFPWYLYGNVNTTIKYLLPGICCSLVLDERKGRRISIPTLIFLAGVIVSAFTLYFTATALIADLFIILWVVFYRQLNKGVWKKYSIVLVIAAIFEYFVVFNTKGSVFVEFITSFFNKTITLSGRTTLWARAYYYFRQNPIWGHGFLSGADLEGYIGNAYGCHNYYLDLLFQRGVVGLILFLLLLVVPVIRGWSQGSKSKSVYLLMGICAACVIMLLAEPFYDVEPMFIPMFYELYSSFSERYIVFSLKKNN